MSISRGKTLQDDAIGKLTSLSTTWWIFWLKAIAKVDHVDWFSESHTTSHFLHRDH